MDKAVWDKDEADGMKAELTQFAFSEDHKRWLKIIGEQSQIIQTQARGSWLQRSWRQPPILGVIAIVANNYLQAPYLSSRQPDHIKVLDLPE